MPLSGRNVYAASKIISNPLIRRSTAKLRWRRLCESTCARSSSFFFQAEGGIRDKLVTGVQTCALPIWQLHRPRDVRRPEVELRPVPLEEGRMPPPLLLRQHVDLGVELRVRRDRARLRQHHPRSEERRVGKACRSRWPAYLYDALRLGLL